MLRAVHPACAYLIGAKSTASPLAPYDDEPPKPPASDETRDAEAGAVPGAFRRDDRSLRFAALFAKAANLAPPPQKRHQTMSEATAITLTRPPTVAPKVLAETVFPWGAGTAMIGDAVGDVVTRGVREGVRVTAAVPLGLLVTAAVPLGLLVPVTAGVPVGDGDAASHARPV